MDVIPIDDRLCMKRLKPLDPKDIWLAEQLDQDELVGGKNGYLYSIRNELRLLQLQAKIATNTLYGSSYSICYHTQPIGYFGISDRLLDEVEYVSFAYALLKQERKKGYMKVVLRYMSNLLLSDISKVELMISNRNEASIHLAQSVGYQLRKNTFLQESEYSIYEKIKIK